ncbi:MAG TPA: ribosomal protein S18-alanine N-acetyltransferase [Gemmatimonadales bacterium]|nr:ribosomal protein S18-alanine N-acetyltransferase [Gemmatimonadales bacterium]
MAEPFRIRPASAEDAAELAELERRCFSDPWSAEAFRATLDTPGGAGFVAEGGGGLVGYVLSLNAGRVAEVLNVAVAPDARRRGLARRLLACAVAALEAEGVREMFLEVRESNAAALRLYEDAGFGRIGRRKGYYRRPAEDALVLRRPPAAAEAAP